MLFLILDQNCAINLILQISQQLMLSKSKKGYGIEDSIYHNKALSEGMTGGAGGTQS